MESAANDNLFVVYGAWFEADFNLNLVSIGLGASVIGAAELIGEFATAFFADRMGLKKSVFWGLGLSAAAYFLLPVFGRSLAGAFVGLFLLFFLFEFGIVSLLSLSTELMPAGRATLIATFFAMAGLGRITGALIGGPVWTAGGIVATSSVSGGMTLVGVFLLWLGLRKWEVQT